MNQNFNLFFRLTFTSSLIQTARTVSKFFSRLLSITHMVSWPFLIWDKASSSVRAARLLLGQNWLQKNIQLNVLQFGLTIWFFSFLKTHQQEVSYIQSNGLVSGTRNDIGLSCRPGSDDGRLRRRRRVARLGANSGGDLGVHTGDDCGFHSLDRSRGRYWRNLQHTTKWPTRLTRCYGKVAQRIFFFRSPVFFFIMSLTEEMCNWILFYIRHLRGFFSSYCLTRNSPSSLAFYLFS